MLAEHDADALAGCCKRGQRVDVAESKYNTYYLSWESVDTAWAGASSSHDDNGKGWEPKAYSGSV